MLSGKAAEGRPRELLPGVARTVRHVMACQFWPTVNFDFDGFQDCSCTTTSIFFERMKKGL